MGEEVEIKLLCDDEAVLSEVFASPDVAPYLVSPPVAKMLHAYYLDTPDLHLAGERIAYRVRREGDRWIAAVKTGKIKTPEGLYVRGEWEKEIPRPLADPGMFLDTEIGERLVFLLGERPLVVLFEIRVTRTSGLLRYPDGTEIELVADRGGIFCHGLHAPLLEVELELKAGKRSRLAALSKALQAVFPLIPGTGSKYARGLTLFREAKKNPPPAEVVFHTAAEGNGGG